jgi:hypothetical protein
MALERDFEMLDDFLANRMSDAERSAMEQKVAADAELKQELSIQRQVIEGLRRARIAELKQMLNNTPIPPPTGSQALLVKLGTAMVTAGIIGTGLYFFLKDDSAAKTQESAAPAQQEPVTTEPQALQPAVAPAIDSQAAGPKAELKAPAPVTEKKKATKDTATQPAREPQKPAAFAPAEEESSTAAPNAEAPVVNGSVKETRHASMAIENAVDKRYNFHYQFKDCKLLLYGPFSEKTTYEILEFFADNKNNTVVLYYKDGYYLLHEDVDKVTPLKAITDPALLAKLKAYRK